MVCGAKFAEHAVPSTDPGPEKLVMIGACGVGPHASAIEGEPIGLQVLLSLQLLYLLGARVWPVLVRCANEGGSPV